MKKIALLLILSLFVATGALRAQETNDEDWLKELGLQEDEHQGGHAIYHFPEIEPEIYGVAGMRFFDVSGSRRVFDYEYLERYYYPFAKGDMRLFEYPHRFHGDFDFHNEKDYLADLNYAYGEYFLFRWFNSTVFHNLENIELTDLNPLTSTPGVDDRDGDHEFGLKTGMSNYLMRLKAHDFPLHFYFRGFYAVAKGDRQQMSLLGSGYFNDLKRVSQKRNIDQVTHKYEFLVNSHLGPAEVELSHAEKRFDVHKDNVLYDEYNTGSAFRPAGTFPHNETPGLKGSSSTVKIHTSYTGKIVAAATFSKKDRENESSGASQDILWGAGQVRWAPLTRLSLYLNYSYKDIDSDTPGTSSITDSSGNTTTYPGTIKSALSSTTNTITATGRYRPESGINLMVKYSLKDVDRSHASDWNLEESTRYNTLMVSADARVVKNVKVKAAYNQKVIDNPSYNTEADFSYKTFASISWLPAARINLLLNYTHGNDERDDLRFTETTNANDRNVRMDNVFASGTFQVLQNLSVTASYSYMRYRVVQDIVYEDLGAIENVDSNVEMEDTAHLYSVALTYIPIDKLSIAAQINHRRSTGDFVPNSQDLLGPVSIASFSQFKLRETDYRISGNYDIKNGYSCGVELKYSDLTDVSDNVHDSYNDGDAYIMLISVKKKWG